MEFRLSDEHLKERENTARLAEIIERMQQNVAAGNLRPVIADVDLDVMGTLCATWLAWYHHAL